ncbi:MAG: CoA transferase [Thermodesulfobacteriota bacterium]|nr:CoA transferase [Thermodesulfobacteriota bacterium]
MSPSLEGIRVLDFGVAYAAPFGVMMLVYMVADVIKIERIEASLSGEGRLLPWMTSIL